MGLASRSRPVDRYHSKSCVYTSVRVFSSISHPCHHAAYR